MKRKYKTLHKCIYHVHHWTQVSLITIWLFSSITPSHKYELVGSKQDWLLNAASCQPSNPSANRSWLRLHLASSECGSSARSELHRREEALRLWVNDDMASIHIVNSSSVKECILWDLMDFIPQRQFASVEESKHDQMNQELWLHYLTLHNRLYDCNSGMMDITTSWTSEKMAHL